jgi:3-isopropylmalate/(R)-2-methylmalate dehydratase small subunit
VVSSFFADIFKNNALNNFLLPVQVSDGFLQQVFDEVEKDPEVRLEVDLGSQTVKLLSTGASEGFDINPYKKECLLNGYDDIDYLLSLRDKIGDYEKAREFNF